MKLKNAKIQDFVKKMSEVTIVLGNNGSGKTSYLKKLYKELIGEKKLSIYFGFLYN